MGRKVGAGLLLGAGVALLYFNCLRGDNFIFSPLISSSSSSFRQGKLAAYSFPNLAKRKYSGSQIKLERVIKKEEKYTSWLFSYQSEGKRVTGMANLPQGNGPFPVIVMLRGYADKEIYFTGLGTRKAAGVLAEHGFLTLAPDFLGFGGSDQESADILEARFTRPITVLNLLASVKTLPQADEERIALWGHSNGGQIALSVLEISQKDYPTTLWAPVTESFPQSVLGYIDEENLSEESRRVKERIEKFCQHYDPTQYSITSFLERIKAPLQLHQGGADVWVPAEWQEKLVKELKRYGRQVNYYFYPHSDHNLKQDWEKVVQRDLEFFRSFLLGGE